MPIRPEMRHFYGKEWRTVIRPRILARDLHQCKRCGKPDRTRVKVLRDGSGRWLDPKFRTWRDRHGAAINRPRGGRRHSITVVLTIAHLDHQPWNNEDGNLAALCQHCHLKHDARQHYATRRRGEAERSGQLLMFEPALEDVAEAGPLG
jgi:5-methylcytosine-specific restriction endonuclease McrA